VLIKPAQFDDVQYASKALNDYYGHTLDGLIKNGGIRLSYSKNPLGVRTPTTVGGPKGFLGHRGSEPTLFGNGHFDRHTHHDVEYVSTATARRESVAAPSFAHYSLSPPPPPRFFSPSPGAGGSYVPTTSTAFTRANPQTFGASSNAGVFSAFGLANARSSDGSDAAEAFLRSRASLAA
jgi:hypothetical protein